MKKFLAIILLIGTGQVATAQQTETRSISSFRGVKAAEGIDVYLKKGDKESLKLEVSGTNLSNVVTEVSGSYLKIHMREGRYHDRSVKVYVTYVEIDKISASSAANIYGEGVLKTTDLEISSSSAASVELILDVVSVDISVSSAANIELDGKTKSLHLDVSSAGQVDAYDLEAETVNVEASSAGSAKVSVTKELEAHASSGADIRYRGNPGKSMTNSSSGGSVKKTN